jgi:hypothetical protein
MHKNLVVKPERKGPGSKYDIMKMEFKEIRCEGVNWVRLAQETFHWLAVVNTIMNFRVP